MKKKGIPSVNTYIIAIIEISITVHRFFVSIIITTSRSARRSWTKLATTVAILWILVDVIKTQVTRGLILADIVCIAAVVITTRCINARVVTLVTVIIKRVYCIAVCIRAARDHCFGCSSCSCCGSHLFLCLGFFDGRRCQNRTCVGIWRTYRRTRRRLIELKRIQNKLDFKFQMLINHSGNSPFDYRRNKSSYFCHQLQFHL